MNGHFFSVFPGELRGILQIRNGQRHSNNSPRLGPGRELDGLPRLIPQALDIARDDSLVLCGYSQCEDEFSISHYG